MNDAVPNSEESAFDFPIPPEMLSLPSETSELLAQNESVRAENALLKDKIASGEKESSEIMLYLHNKFDQQNEIIKTLKDELERTKSRVEATVVIAPIPDESDTKVIVLDTFNEGCSS